MNLSRDVRVFWQRIYTCISFLLDFHLSQLDTGNFFPLGILLGQYCANFFFRFDMKHFWEKEFIFCNLQRSNSLSPSKIVNIFYPSSPSKIVNISQ